jgi:citrate lyase beta subunit
MLKSYFFIPANNPRFIAKAKNINADYIVYDLEDSVGLHELDQSLINIKDVSSLDKCFVRPRLYSDADNTIDGGHIKELIMMGFKNFILPKFSKLQVIRDLNTLLENVTGYVFEDFTFFVLIEDPKGLLNFRELLDERLINITGVGFGSHDYCNVMQIKPTPKNLYYARNQILLMARAYNITAVDIISMETEREDVFIEEALDGFEMGYRDKFILHPVQLEWLGHVNYYTDEEVNDAINIHGKILEAKKLGTSIIVVDGQAYEKPHIQRIQTIVEWSKHNSSG